MATDDETGRFKQRRRTRAGIVAATMELLRQGVTPSVVEIADAADVSRRTVYMHFPTIEQLLVDATLGALSERAVEEAIDAAGSTVADVDARVDAMVAALGAKSAETLSLGRTLIRLTVDDGQQPQAGGPRRGYRRIAWIERAIEPLRDRLDPARFERLVSGLAMIVGWEGLIVLQDLRGLTSEAQLDVTSWSAQALIRAALAEAAGPSP